MFSVSIFMRKLTGVDRIRKKRLCQRASVITNYGNC